MLPFDLTDPAVLPWSEEERATLARSEETQHLLNEFPSGVHARPEGGPDSDVVLALGPMMSVRCTGLPFPVDPHYPKLFSGDWR